MSVADVIARIGQIEATIASIESSAAPTAPSPTVPFASALAGSLATAPSATTQATATAASPTVPADLAGPIRQAAAANGIDPALLAAVASAESGFNPRAVSPAGAQGLMQLMPGTARGLGVTSPFDATQSLQGGARYLRSLLDRFGGDTSLAVAGYNAGPNAVARAGGIPPYAETQSYVSRVLATYSALRGTGF